MKMRTWFTTLMFLAMAGGAWAGTAPDSKRMERAKDYFAEEQWARAIAEFQAVAADPKEANRDEALFWLAQSEHETGDQSAAIQTIVRLERQFPKSPWVRFARSLRVEIAQRLNRADVLWAYVMPPPPPPAPTPRPGATPMAAPPAPPPAPPGRTGLAPRPPMMAPPQPAPAAAPVPPAAMPGVVPPTPPAPPTATTPPRPMARPGFFATPAPAMPVPGAEFFLPTPYPPDTDLQIEALNGLIELHPDRVIPLLRDIALDGDNPDDGRRAIFVLARSQRPEARTTVFDVARRGAEPVRIAAIRAMGRFEGLAVNAELMKVYSLSSTPRVKRQVVSSLGERADNVSLLRIAKDESDMAVRNTAIVTLGRLPNARPQLRTLYGVVRPESRMAVMSALFSSRDEEELIRIARMEKEPLLRQHVRLQLRMLGTPKALKFLQDNP
jgi:hypothetical protein